MYSAGYATKGSLPNTSMSLQHAIPSQCSWNSVGLTVGKNVLTDHVAFGIV